MTKETISISLDFHSLTIDDREAMQSISLTSERRNCNLNFSNLIGWKFLFDTEICILDNMVIIVYYFEHLYPVYLLCSQTFPEKGIVDTLRTHAAEKGYDLTLIAIEDEWAKCLSTLYPNETRIEQLRDSYDYIYSREKLEKLEGKELKSKRNHVNKFLSEHPDYEYRQLNPDLFDKCRRLEEIWRTETPHDNPWYGNTIESEQRMMETVFSNWNHLGMMGGAILVGEELVAFTCGSAVTHDTFDTCLEKANRSIDGAFNIINQQFALHLPRQYRYINREEDMGLEGLRKAKLSYHPEYLLSYNRVTIAKP